MFRRFIFLLVFIAFLLCLLLILYTLRPMQAVQYYYVPSKKLPSIDWCQPLQWQNPPAKNVIALVSYPGSGNTWLRYLLQQATGIITGSYLRDKVLMKNGFPGEGVSNGSVLIVKSHKTVTYNAAVLLIRNPRDAILAEFNRIWCGHIGTAPKSAYERRETTLTKSPKNDTHLSDNPKNETWILENCHESMPSHDWESHVHNHLEYWQATNVGRMSLFSAPTYVVRYEDLVSDVRRVLLGILEFLDIKVSEEQLECATSRKEGIYRRREKLHNFDPFTLEMNEQIEAVKTKVHAVIEKHEKENYHLNKFRRLRKTRWSFIAFLLAYF